MAVVRKKLSAVPPAMHSSSFRSPCVETCLVRNLLGQKKRDKCLIAFQTKMPLNCIVGGCTTTWSSSNKHISFFRFPSPKTDSERYRIWLRFVQRTRSDFEGPGISHGEGSRLCSLHFLESDCEDSYILKKRLLPSQNERLLPTLKKNAVPTLLPRKGRLKKNVIWQQ